MKEGIDYQIYIYREQVCRCRVKEEYILPKTVSTIIIMVIDCDFIGFSQIKVIPHYNILL